MNYNVQNKNDDKCLTTKHAAVGYKIDIMAHLGTYFVGNNASVRSHCNVPYFKLPVLCCPL